jgi:ATP-dependent RNA helicase DDX5/DBP2
MIPCVAKIMELKAKFSNPQSQMIYFGGPLGLVVAPTRELAIQIYNSATALTLCCGLSMSVVYGGATKDNQLNQISNGVDILIATPGRLIDFLAEGSIQLSQVSFLVLDEADRMLDMGFAPQVHRILMFLNPGKQTVFLSATWPEEVESLAYEICTNNPAKIKVGEHDLTLNQAITQVVKIVDDSEKRKELLELIRNINDFKSKIIIFVRTKKCTDRLAIFLEHEGYPSYSMHGDKHQQVCDWF